MNSARSFSASLRSEMSRKPTTGRDDRSALVTDRSGRYRVDAVGGRPELLLRDQLAAQSARKRQLLDRIGGPIGAERQALVVVVDDLGRGPGDVVLRQHLPGEAAHVDDLVGWSGRHDPDRELVQQVEEEEALLLGRRAGVLLDGIGAPGRAKQPAPSEHGQQQGGQGGNGHHPRRSRCARETRSRASS
jgi:hypothetical protein